MIATVKLSDGTRINLANIALVNEWRNSNNEPCGQLFFIGEVEPMQFSLEELALVNAALDTFAVQIPQ